MNEPVTITIPPQAEEMPPDLQVGDSVCVYGKVTATDDSGTTIEYERTEKSSDVEGSAEEEAGETSQDEAAEDSANPQMDYIKSRKKKMAESAS